VKKSIALFLTLLTLQATSTITGKQVADRLADIERQSHRKFKIFLNIDRSFMQRCYFYLEVEQLVIS